MIVKINLKYPSGPTASQNLPTLPPQCYTSIVIACSNQQIELETKKVPSWQSQRSQENAFQVQVTQEMTSEGEVSKLERQSSILTDYCNSGCQLRSIWAAYDNQYCPHLVNNIRFIVTEDVPRIKFKLYLMIINSTIYAVES